MVFPIQLIAQLNNLCFCSLGLCIDFHTQMKRKSSIAMCYFRSQPSGFLKSSTGTKSELFFRKSRGPVPQLKAGQLKRSKILYKERQHLIRACNSHEAKADRLTPGSQKARQKKQNAKKHNDMCCAYGHWNFVLLQYTISKCKKHHAQHQPLTPPMRQRLFYFQFSLVNQNFNI